jgi:hypothetical protein
VGGVVFVLFFVVGLFGVVVVCVVVVLFNEGDYCVEDTEIHKHSFGGKVSLTVRTAKIRRHKKAQNGATINMNYGISSLRLCVTFAPLREIVLISTQNTYAKL